MSRENIKQARKAAKRYREALYAYHRWLGSISNTQGQDNEPYSYNIPVYWLLWQEASKTGLTNPGVAAGSQDCFLRDYFFTIIQGIDKQFENSFFENRVKYSRTHHLSDASKQNEALEKWRELRAYYTGGGSTGNKSNYEKYLDLKKLIYDEENVLTPNKKFIGLNRLKENFVLAISSPEYRQEMQSLEQRARRIRNQRKKLEAYEDYFNLKNEMGSLIIFSEDEKLYYDYFSDIQDIKRIAEDGHLSFGLVNTSNTQLARRCGKLFAAGINQSLKSFTNKILSNQGAIFSDLRDFQNILKNTYKKFLPEAASHIDLVEDLLEEPFYTRRDYILGFETKQAQLRNIIDDQVLRAKAGIVAANYIVMIFEVINLAISVKKSYLDGNVNIRNNAEVVNNLAKTAVVLQKGFAANSEKVASKVMILSIEKIALVTSVIDAALAIYDIIEIIERGENDGVVWGQGFKVAGSFFGVSSALLALGPVALSNPVGWLAIGAAVLYLSGEILLSTFQESAFEKINNRNYFSINWDAHSSGSDEYSNYNQVSFGWKDNVGNPNFARMIASVLSVLYIEKLDVVPTQGYIYFEVITKCPLPPKSIVVLKKYSSQSNSYEVSFSKPLDEFLVHDFSVIPGDPEKTQWWAMVTEANDGLEKGLFYSDLQLEFDVILNSLPVSIEGEVQAFSNTFSPNVLRKRFLFD